MKNLVRNLLFVFILVIFTLTSLNFSFSKKTDNRETINIEIRGNVKNNRTIQTKLGSTFGDILPYIEFNEDSDISDLALNSILYNNQIINIRKKSTVKLISINNATIEELCSIKGIGKQTAAKIIKYRENNGSFHSLDELKNVSGIGEKKYEIISEYITL